MKSRYGRICNFRGLSNEVGSTTDYYYFFVGSLSVPACGAPTGLLSSSPFQSKGFSDTTLRTAWSASASPPLMMEHSLLQKLAPSVARATNSSWFSQNFSGFIIESPTSGQPTAEMVGYPTSVEWRKSLKPTFSWFYNKTCLAISLPSFLVCSP